ncbi:MAG: phosphoglucosamine mutase [Firmicutes bacterium HGW-Firmicutes-13]|nr:MAG: phosphoglucosamine mutase [Firmicutes bacterium HGW-Firmicutes-13]
MRKLFGTDGIRGKANVEPMTSELALRLGRAAAYILHRGKSRPKILIGKDPRISSDMLEAALSSGIVSAGADCIRVGMLPTPGIAYLTKALEADAGIVISASHNPFDDNGIKFFGPDGFKLSDETEEEIEKAIQTSAEGVLHPTGIYIGRMIDIADASAQYQKFLQLSVENMDLSGSSILLDCAHGATSHIAPELFSQLGARIITLNNKPDGTNINLDCGSMYPELIGDAIREHKADIGFCFDGDGDRIIVVDENGQVIDGDFIIMACAKHMKETGELKNNTVVITVMTNLGFHIACRETGIIVRETGVGDRYVTEEMLNCGAVLGGEQSGHIVFFDHHTSGDGMLTALQLLKILKETKQPASSMGTTMKKFPQILLNVLVKEKPPLEDMPEVQKAIQDAIDILKDSGRVVVRYSGTEMKCRVMIEGEDDGQITELAQGIAGKIEERIGA